AVRARAVGVGAPLPEDRVRAAMFARAAGMAQGGSGVSVAVFRALVDALNRGLCPHVPCWGSIGVADLPQMSPIAPVLMWRGDAARAGPGRGSRATAESARRQRPCDGRGRATRPGPAVVSLRRPGARSRA